MTDPSLRYTVVIVTYRRHASLCDTLRALGPHIDPANGEVLVIDQCPPGPLPDDVLATPTLRYISLDRPGMVAARNVGIRNARGEVILFLDDDVIPLPGLIEGHLAAYVDPSVGGVAGRILDPGQTAAPPPHPKVFDPADGWRHAHFDHTIPGDVMTVRGCNMSFRRDLLVRLGGFDLALAPPYSFREDTDMSVRVRAAGYRVRFVPDAALVHLNSPSGGTRDVKLPDSLARAELKRYRALYQHQSNNLYFVLRHFRGRARWASLWWAYRDYVGLSRWPWRLAAKNACFFAALVNAARLARFRRYHPCTLTECALSRPR
jgi:GT2 family glycosyltransferase